MNLYKLTQAVTASRPSCWQTHLRYALQLPGPELTVPAGAWLLELPPEGDGADGENVLYRLADGTLVTLSRPLADGEAMLVDNPQAPRAMAAYRPPEQAALEDWGVHLEHVDRSAPFRLIKCPVCWKTESASVDFAHVWCNTCNVTFTVRHTSADAGWVVDCNWSTTPAGSIEVDFAARPF